MKKFFALICFICFFVPFTAHALTINKIAAVVNGKMITVYDLQKVIAPELARNNIDPRNPANQTTIDSMIRSALDSEVLGILIEEEALRQNLTVSPAEVEMEISAIMANSRMSKQDFERQLEKEGLTADDLRERINKSILRQKLMGMMIGRKVVVTNEEIKEYYEKNKNNFSKNSSVHLSLIIYPNNENAEKWATKIKNNQTSFEEVAKNVSVGPNPENGGDVGEVLINEISAALRTQVDSLSPGQISSVFTLGPNKAQILLKNKTTATNSVSLEDVSKEIDAILRKPKTMERFEEFQQQLKDKAVIDIRL